MKQNKISSKVQLSIQNNFLSYFFIADWVHIGELCELLRQVCLGELSRGITFSL